MSEIPHFSYPMLRERTLTLCLFQFSNNFTCPRRPGGPGWTTIVTSDTSDNGCIGGWIFLMPPFQVQVPFHNALSSKQQPGDKPPTAPTVTQLLDVSLVASANSSIISKSYAMPLFYDSTSQRCLCAFLYQVNFMYISAFSNVQFYV